MLDTLVQNILEIGIYLYLIPSFIGFIIFSESLYLFDEEQHKFISWVGLLLIFSFVIIEYFSKTDIHLITDILISLKTGHLKFSNGNFLTFLFITFIVSGIFWRYTLIALAISFIFYFGFPQETIDIGFIIFVFGAGYQVYELTKKKEDLYSYSSGASISFESFSSILITILTLVIKILKIF